MKYFLYKEASAHERVRKRADGHWHCKKCGEQAESEHKKEECHRCQDWGYCGTDCTLSKLICKKCKRVENV